MLTTRFTKPEVTELSVSAWFYRNRTLAGFDNPARSLYVSIRELVENSLDACESNGILPDINIRLRPQNVSDPRGDFAAGPEVFELAIQDNGGGIHRENVPKLIGKMLTGTKFTHKQSRGTFGLGGSLALLYGQVTTQKPIEIRTGVSGESHLHIIRMRLEIDKNEPDIIHESRATKETNEHGTTIKYYLQGDWIRSKRRILDYFNQTSVIVPYSSIWFQTPEGELLEYERVIHALPIRSREVKPHPKGIDVEFLKTMISKTRFRNFKSFLMNSFQRIGPSTADSFLEHASISPEIDPRNILESGLLKMMGALETFDGFRAPTAKSLSPAGEAAFQAGMLRMHPEFMVSTQRTPSVHAGHPFIIEAGIAFGGDLPSGITLYRFANRIPLLYDEGSDVSTRVIRKLNLRSYGFQADNPIAFFVHLCSTKVPYKTVGKEYIADVDAVRREIDLGLKDCLRRLSEQVKRRDRVQRTTKRENRLRNYYQFIARTLEESTSRQIELENLFRGEDI